MKNGFVLKGIAYPKNLEEKAFPYLPKAATHVILDNEKHSIIALFTNEETMRSVYNDLKEKHPSYSMGLAYDVEIRLLSNE